MSPVRDEPPPDAIGLLEMAEQLGIVAAIKPVDLSIGGAPALPMILIPTRWDPVTLPLFKRLADGRLVSWGRLGGLLEPWTRLPSDERVWRQMEVDWGHGVLTLFDERPVWTLTLNGESAQRTETINRVVVATLHGCRVAWAAQAVEETTPAGRRQGRNIDDTVLLARIGARVMAGEDEWAVAGELAAEAAGHGTVESKQKRLSNKFRKLSLLRTE